MNNVKKISLKLGDLFLQIKDGGTPSSSREEYYKEGNINWLVIKDIKKRITGSTVKITDLGLKNCSSLLWEPGDIILSTGATIGEVGILEVPAATKQGICGIKVNKNKVDTEFLYYKLESLKSTLNKLSQGGTIKETRPDKVVDIDVEIPEKLEDQKKIAKILSNVDENIRLALDAVERLEQIKIGVDKNLFGDKSVTIPLSELTNLITKGTTPTSIGFEMTKTDPVNFVKIDELIDGQIPRKTYARISHKCNEAMKRSQLEEGDILFSIAGTLGLAVRVNKESLPANTNQALAIIRLKNPKDTFVFRYLNSTLIKKYVIESTTKGAIPNLNLEQIGNIQIPVLEDSEKKKAEEVLYNFEKNIVIAKSKLEQLQKLKQGLLSDLL